LTRQAVTKRVKVLEDTGLVRSARVGRDRSWRVEPRRLSRTPAYFDCIATQWDAQLERLRAFVEVGDD
jgi:DNA-binding transcriptional ArsR family regulator